MAFHTAPKSTIWLDPSQKIMGKLRPGIHILQLRLPMMFELDKLAESFRLYLERGLYFYILYYIYISKGDCYLKILNIHTKQYTCEKIPSVVKYCFRIIN